MVDQSSWLIGHVPFSIVGTLTRMDPRWQSVPQEGRQDSPEWPVTLLALAMSSGCEHFAVANDLDQAVGRQFSEISEMLRRHPFLRSKVQADKKRLEFRRTYFHHHRAASRCGWQQWR